jgi:beta-glucosidase
MDRRTFLTAAGVGASAAFLPRVLPAALANLGDADIERRVQELLAKMSLDDKVAQMSGEVLGNGMQLLGYNKFAPTKTPDNQRLGIPGIKFVDGPRGINFKGCTCFPVSIARGASWTRIC